MSPGRAGNEISAGSSMWSRSTPRRPAQALRPLAQERRQVEAHLLVAEAAVAADGAAVARPAAELAAARLGLGADVRGARLDVEARGAVCRRPGRRRGTGGRCRSCTGSGGLRGPEGRPAPCRAAVPHGRRARGRSRGGSAARSATAPPAPRASPSAGMAGTGGRSGRSARTPSAAARGSTVRRVHVSSGCGSSRRPAWKRGHSSPPALPTSTTAAAGAPDGPAGRSSSAPAANPPRTSSPVPAKASVIAA